VPPLQGVARARGFENLTPPHPAPLATNKSVIFKDLELLVFLIAFLIVEIMMLL
jgi:hypothetical protein